MKSFRDETSAIAARLCVRHGLRAGAAMGCLWLSNCATAPPPEAPDPVRVTWTSESSRATAKHPGARQAVEGRHPIVAPPAATAVVATRGAIRARGAKRRSEPSLPSVRWLSPEHVSRAVRAHHAEFSACRTLGGSTTRARGETSVTLGWRVEADGAVSEVDLSRTSFESAQVNECMLATARDVRFPPSPAPSEISWTVRFQADGPQLAANPLRDSQ